MKIPEEQKEEIINGMLDMLHPEAVEEVEEIKNISGGDLIKLHGILQTQDGRPILYGVLYSVSTTTIKKIDHRQKIGQIIADASTMAEWTEKLGAYLAKYAKDRAAVVRSIPAHLSLKNIKQNDN